MTSRALVAFRVAARVAPIVPRPWSVALALAVADLLAQQDTPPLRQHQRNIARAVGRLEDDPHARAVARRAVRVQTLNYLDFFRNAQLPFAQQRRVASFTGADVLREALAPGRGALVVGAHLGSVDRLGHLFPVFGFPAAAFVEQLRPPEFHAFVTRIRERAGSIAITIGPDAPARAAAALREGRVVGIAVDWAPSGDGVVVPFLGHHLVMPVGAAVLALRYRVPLTPIRALRRGLERFEVIADPPIPVATAGSLNDRVAETSRRIAAVIERHIRETPDQWVMFHDIWADGASSQTESGDQTA